MLNSIATVLVLPLSRYLVLVSLTKDLDKAQQRATKNSRVEVVGAMLP